MAENNFLIFNEANDPEFTMRDTDYEDNFYRKNGVIPMEADPLAHNKMYRQWSIMCRALGEYIKSKGYDALDSDIEILAQNLISALDGRLNEHDSDFIMSELGAHGFRYFNASLQAFNKTTETWITISTGGGSSSGGGDVSWGSNALSDGKVIISDGASVFQSGTNLSDLALKSEISGGKIIGEIFMFDGAFNSSGFPINPKTSLVMMDCHICDGTHGTPNLIDKFIMSVAPSNLGSIGGSNYTTLQSNNIPQISTDSTGAHSHTLSGSAASAGAHTHTYNAHSATLGATGGTVGSHVLMISPTSANTGSSGSHLHTLSGTAASAGAHTHTIGNVSPASMDNRPAFYGLCFVKKIA